MIQKPAALYGRDREWRVLAEFVEQAAIGGTLGLVYGRRRQGKTFLLANLARETGGFFFGATQQDSAQSLRALSEAYQTFTGRSVGYFADWRQAVDALFELGEHGAAPVPVVIDEFPYLVDAVPALPSIIQIAMDPLRPAKERSRTRLILCGSALTTMRRLLDGTAPLRGRAQLDLMLHSFRFRDAAELWGLADRPEVAFRLNALVGGTPAYRDMCVRGPRTVAGFDEWVADRLLDPGQVMFDEGDVLLHQQPELMDPALYFAVLGAISRGNHRRTEIAQALDRPPTALAHPLAVLEDVRLIAKVDDALRAQRPVYLVTEPVIRFHQLVTARNPAQLALGEARRVWSAVQDTVSSKIYGPHLEDLAREWTLAYADERTLGGWPSKALPATLACREHRTGHELDVVALADDAGQATRVLAIGECKATLKAVGRAELERLDHIRDLLPSDRVRGPIRLLLFARSGFTAELRRAAGARDDVELIDLERLYAGR
jgi:uncharacterized protein